MHEKTTTILDALGLLLIAAGVATSLYQWIGWWAVSVAGGIVLAGSAWAGWQARRPGRTPA